MHFHYPALASKRITGSFINTVGWCDACPEHRRGCSNPAFTTAKDGGSVVISREPVRPTAKDGGSVEIGTTPWMGEVEQRMERLPKATQGADAEETDATETMWRVAKKCNPI